MWSLHPHPQPAIPGAYAPGALRMSDPVTISAQPTPRADSLRPGESGMTQDRGLEARALRGDDAAWNTLIRTHDRRVWTTLLAMGADPDTASDVTQEAWIKLVQRARAGTLTELRLPGLAITQARFLYLNRLEGRKDTVPTDDPDRPLHLADQAVDAEQRLASAQQLDRVLAELGGLPERTRAMMGAVYEEGITAAEASARFGLSVQRVRQTLCEVRHRLRTALGGDV